jgi:Flp pilus assembly protein TadD
MMRKLASVGCASLVAIGVSACASDPVAQRQQRVAQDPSAMMRIAEAAGSLGDPEGALAFYRRAADLQPDSVDANIGIARSLAMQGKVDQAIETLQSAKGSNPSDSRLTATLGRLLVVADFPADGLATFEEGLARDPNSVPLLIGQGVALDAMSRHDEAQDSYRKALQLDPGNAAARKNLALSKAIDGKGTREERPRSLSHS